MVTRQKLHAPPRPPSSIFPGEKLRGDVPHGQAVCGDHCRLNLPVDSVCMQDCPCFTNPGLNITLSLIIDLAIRFVGFDLLPTHLEPSYSNPTTICLPVLGAYSRRYAKI